MKQRNLVRIRRERTPEPPPSLGTLATRGLADFAFRATTQLPAPRRFVERELPALTRPELPESIQQRILSNEPLQGILGRGARAALAGPSLGPIPFVNAATPGGLAAQALRGLSDEAIGRQVSMEAINATSPLGIMGLAAPGAGRVVGRATRALSRLPQEALTQEVLNTIVTKRPELIRIARKQGFQLGDDELAAMLENEYTHMGVKGVTDFDVKVLREIQRRAGDQPEAWAKLARERHSLPKLFGRALRDKAGKFGEALARPLRSERGATELPEADDLAKAGKEALEAIKPESVAGAAAAAGVSKLRRPPPEELDDYRVRRKKYYYLPDGVPVRLDDVGEKTAYVSFADKYTWGPVRLPRQALRTIPPEQYEAVAADFEAKRAHLEATDPLALEAARSQRALSQLADFAEGSVDDADDAIEVAKQPWEMTLNEWAPSAWARERDEALAAIAKDKAAIKRGDVGLVGPFSRYKTKKAGLEALAKSQEQVTTPPADWSKFSDSAKGNRHRDYVMRALEDGKPVPPQVLAEYPELAKAAPVRDHPSTEGAPVGRVSQPKQPWEMTQNEAVAYKQEIDRKHAQLVREEMLFIDTYGAESEDAKAATKAVKDFELENASWTGAGGRQVAVAQHRETIRAALEMGKPVPPEVLAEYLDLAAGRSAQIQTPAPEGVEVSSARAEEMKARGEIEKQNQEQTPAPAASVAATEPAAAATPKRTSPRQRRERAKAVAKGKLPAASTPGGALPPTEPPTGSPAAAAAPEPEPRGEEPLPDYEPYDLPADPGAVERHAEQRLREFERMAANAKQRLAREQSAADMASKASLAKQGKAFNAGERRGAIQARAAERQAQLELRASIIGRLKEHMAQVTERRVMQGMRKAANIAARETTRTVTKAERAAAKLKAQQLQRIKNDIVIYAQHALPLSLRGKFLKAVASTKTEAQLIKVFRRIAEEANKHAMRQAIARLHRVNRRIARSEKIAVDLQQRALEIMRGVDLRKLTPKRQKRLESLKGYLERKRAAGEPVEVPRRLLEELSRLNAVDAHSMRPSDLEALADRLELLEQLGITKWRTRQELFALEKEETIKSLLYEMYAASDVPRGVSSIEQLQREPGDPSLTAMEHFKNWMADKVSKLMAADVALTPVDAIMQAMGAMRLKRMYDLAYHEYAVKRHNLSKPAQDLANKLGLTLQDLELIGIHAIRVQDFGINYLLDKGLTKEKIASIKLNDVQMQYYRGLRDGMESIYPESVEKLRVDNNRKLGKIENYFSVQTDPKAIDNLPLTERMEKMLQAPAFKRPKKNVKAGAIEERKGGMQNIRLNALDIYLHHIDEMAYFNATERTVRMITEILADERVAAAAGDIGIKTLQNWASVLARKGGPGEAGRVEWLDFARANLGAAALGWKLTSWLVQYTALFDGAAQLGHGVFGSFKAVIVSKPLRAFLYDNFPELRERGADDIAYLELSDKPVLHGLQQMGYSWLRQADLLTYSGVLLEAYKQALAARGIKFDPLKPQVDKEAILEAQEKARASQASSMFKDLPLALSNAGLSKALGAKHGNISLDRTLLQYKGFGLTRWAQMRIYAYQMGILEGDPAKAARIMGWLLLAILAESGIRAGVRTGRSAAMALVVGGPVLAAKVFEEELEKEYAELPQNYFRELFGSVPFVGEMISFAVYRGTLVPVLAGPVKAGTGIYQALTAKKPETRVAGIGNIIEGAGSLAGIPGTAEVGQAVRAGAKAARVKVATSRRRRRRRQRRQRTTR